MSKQYLSITTIDWSSGKIPLQSIRRQVFIEEQQVPEKEEWDNDDPVALHFLATTEDQQAVACGRLVVKNGKAKIGRLAVLKPYRGQGVGRQLMQFILAQPAETPFSDWVLDSQVHAIPFYQSLGFTARGPVFMDAGIPHRKMVKPSIPQKPDLTVE